MTGAERWLREHSSGAPDALVGEMIHALPRDAASVPDALATGAMALLAGLARECGGRDDAWALLAADALLTAAFEAQAELDPDGVAALAERLGAAGRIGELAAGLGAA